MIKDQMNFPLSVDTTNVKATTDVLYSATDEELKAYTIGFIPWEMVQESVLCKGIQIGNFSNVGNQFSYEVVDSFAPNKGVPFCYAFSQNAGSSAFNAYNSGDGYVNMWGNLISTIGLIHSYNTGAIINSTPNQIPETNNMYAWFRMFIVYLPEGSEGGASPGSGVNGWVTSVSQRTGTIDMLNLSFSVNSGTDGQYMPTSVTFTEADLEGAVNGIMKKSNGTTTYQGVTYNITVHCAISQVYLNQLSATQLKDSVIQLDRIRYSCSSSANTEPFFYQLSQGGTAEDIFTANAIGSVSIEYESGTVYYIHTSDNSWEYFRNGYGNNNFVSGGYTLTDLKIIRSVSRPVYKINNAFYVAEFNDDYTITGELTLYENARDWQKNINPDNNEFDYNDIPDPEPTGDESLATGEWLVNGTLPTGSADGFVTMYVLNERQIQNFGADLWAKFFDEDFLDSIAVAISETFSLDTSAILEYIVSLKFYPLNIPTLSNYVGNIPGTIFVGRGIVGIDVSNSTIGKLSHYTAGYAITSKVIEPEFNDFRDYEPCTRIILYVPFCGVVELTPSQVVGGRVKLEYTFDFSTGACTAAVSIINKENLTYCVCTLNGNIGANVQLSASNLTQALQRGINMAVNTVKNIGTAVISAGTAMGEASAYGEAGYTPGGASPSATEGKIMQAGLQSHANNLASITSLEALPAPSFGQSSGFSSFLVTTPMIQRTYHHYELPSNYAHVYGYACNKAMKLEDLIGKGYTVCKNVDLSGIPATQDELSAIESLLTSGVYF